MAGILLLRMHTAAVVQRKKILPDQIQASTKSFLIWAVIAISDLSVSVAYLLPRQATRRIEIELRKQHETVKNIFYRQVSEFQKINSETVLQ